MTKPGKLIIFCAPSGSGKSTLVQWLMAAHPELHLAFSISCTSRPPRGTEQNGVEYFFISPDEFRQRVAADEFLEYEEVYEGRFYGTLKSQVDTQTQRGENVLFDVDVKGGCNIKDFYGDRALSIFVQPPSIEELRRRLARSHRAARGQGCLRAYLCAAFRPCRGQRRPGACQGGGLPTRERFCELIVPHPIPSPSFP